jgi:hypothetical protein
MIDPSSSSVPISDLLTDAQLELDSIEMHALAQAVRVARATIIEQTYALGRPLLRVPCPNPDASAFELTP